MPSTYEFLMWSNCNCNCDFCGQRRSVNKDTIVFDFNRFLPCNQVAKFLDSVEFIDNSNLFLVGGELFDHRLDDEFINLMQLIVSKMIANKINKLYLSTNLTYSPLDYINNVLDLLKANNLLSRVQLITSYDIAGRFESNEQEKLMLDNLQSIQLSYSEIEIIINIVLTKQCCDAILDGEFSIKQFAETHNVLVNLLPYEIVLNDYTPTEKKLEKALIVVENENPGYLIGLYQRLNEDSMKISYEYLSGNTNLFNKLEKTYLDCGHSSVFNKCYKNQDKCFLCEIYRIGNK